jgi:hypothetical protein
MPKTNAVPGKFIYGFAILCASSYAQSITVVNTANSAITPSSIVGESVAVQILGAAPNSLVALTYNYNGGAPQVWNAGYTDSNGNWSYSANSPTSQIGTWFEQWSVGGTNIGSTFSFEIFDLPSSATRSVGSSSPNCCGSSYLSYRTNTFGPSANVTYQIVGSTGSNETVPNTGLGIMMEPEESIGGGAYGDIGCTGSGCPSGWLWTPPSAKYASSTGAFNDVPVAMCSNGAFSGVAFSTQQFKIKIGNNLYGPIATINIAASSSSAGHGTITGTFSYSQ